MKQRTSPTPDGTSASASASATASSSVSQSWRAGRVFRRKDISSQSPSVDRELSRRLQTGQVCKAARGLYYVPKQTPFGPVPPEPSRLLAKFLDDKQFLVFNPSAYNTLGLGTTQLYNRTTVYNHKRHGTFTLAGFEFDFRQKRHFPQAAKVTREFLLVDMLNNIDTLAEDSATVLQRVQTKLATFDAAQLQAAARQYGTERTRQQVTALLTALPAQA
ncbi:MAG: hypothetical protein Q8S34_14835 [Hydrogenophaga sp.]|nr:hypothetical protein [Hydrogenophaga sp.]